MRPTIGSIGLFLRAEYALAASYQRMGMQRYLFLTHSGRTQGVPTGPV